MDGRGIKRQISRQTSVNDPLKRQPSKQKSIDVPLKRQLSRKKSINVFPEKMDKSAAKDEHSRLIQAETAETGNVSFDCDCHPLQCSARQGTVGISHVQAALTALTAT